MLDVIDVAFEHEIDHTIFEKMCLLHYTNTHAKRVQKPYNYTVAAWHIGAWAECMRQHLPINK